MAKLITGTAVAGTSVTFTTNQTWTSPVGVTNLLTVVGKGQDGAPATTGYYDPSTERSANIISVAGLSGPNPYVGVGLNGTGTADWATHQNTAPNAATTLNTGGTGTVQATVFWQYSDGFHYVYSNVSYTNAIPSSAKVYTGSGWRTSGPILAGQDGLQGVTWLEQGAYHPATSATTGASTTGFSKTFAGGVGVSATSTTYTNVAITASTGYPIVVPTGGYITITY